MKTRILLFPCIIGFCVLGNIARASELSPEIEAIMDAVILAHEAENDHTKKGRGVANVSLIINSGQKKLEEESTQACFWFKGRSRRTDMTPIDSGESDKMAQVSMATNGEFYYKYNRFVDGAIVQRANAAGFIGELGKDFNPNVFFFWMRSPLSDAFRNMKVNCPSDLDVQFDEKGLLKFMGSYNEKVKYDTQEINIKETFYILLDPQHAYRIQKYRFEQENVSGPGSSRIEEMELTWNDSERVEMYPESVKFDRTTIRSAKQIKNTPEGTKLDREVETHLRINVKEFRSDVNIDDNIFTLEGMGIKYGTKIDDQIAGILYTYGSNKVTEGTLKFLLHAPNPISKARSASEKCQVTEKTETTPHHIQAPQNKKVVLENEATENTTKQGTHYTLNILLIVVIVIIVVALVLLIFVQRRKTRTSNKC